MHCWFIEHSLLCLVRGSINEQAHGVFEILLTDVSRLSADITEPTNSAWFTLNSISVKFVATKSFKFDLLVLSDELMIMNYFCVMVDPRID